MIMIKTYLKHFIFDKFINQLFDGFIDMFHKPVTHYTIYDFPVGKKINTLATSYKCYEFTNGVVISNEILFGDVTISIRYTNAILHSGENKYNLAVRTSSIYLSEIIEYT